jgi:MHS family proline/betaine transporter-like MFS transporter
MALPTAGIGMLPSYATIGIAAPILLCLMRLLQGLALGGEFSVCISYLVEHSPDNKRGLIGSASFVSMCIGLLLGSFTAYLMRSYISEETLSSWAWRVPFVFGLAIGLVGLYIRLNLTESPVYIEAKEKGKIKTAPIMETIRGYWQELLMAIIIYITVTAPFQTLTAYIETFLHTSLKYTALEATQLNTVGLIIMICTMPLAALISDRIGRKPVIAASSATLAIAIYPIFLIFGRQDFWQAMMAQSLFAFILAFYMGSVPTILVEIFPTRVRLTGVALSYNLSAAIFGGTAPMTAIALEHFTCNKYAMGIYLAFLSAFTFLIIMKYFRETYKKELYA